MVKFQIQFKVKIKRKENKNVPTTLPASNTTSKRTEAAAATRILYDISFS